MLDPRIISVVAWDLDNTLYDRNDALRGFFRWYLARLGCDTPEQEGQARLDAIMALDNGGDGDRLAFCRAVQGLLGHDPDRADQLWNLIRVKLPEFIRPEGATAACLFRLREHYQFALISNGGGALQRTKLQSVGVPHYFPPEHVFISGEVGFEKPDPRIFETALRTLSQRPEQVLYVGDHRVNDMAGAAAVGMPTCWVSRGRPLSPDLPCDVVIEAPWELAPLLLPRSEGGVLEET